MTDDIDPGQMSPPMYGGASEQRGVSLVRELSPEEHLQQMIYQLQGKMWDPVTMQYKTLDGVKPFMNEKGINAFYQYATAVLSPIVTMSNYTNKYDMIHNMMGLIVKRATKHFYLHWSDYEIESRTMINIVTSKLLVLGLSAFYKAIGAGDRKAATSNITETVQTLMKGGTGSEGGGQDSSGKSNFLSRLLRGG